jgi:hypothetical protein
MFCGREKKCCVWGGAALEIKMAYGFEINQLLFQGQRYEKVMG